MAVIEMSVQNWATVRDNPRQRNTEKRARIALKRHLKQYEKPHRFVYAAIKDGEILCKIDGHTRSLLWELGELSTPPDGKVEVLLIEVSGLEEAKRLYDMFDGQQPTKKPADAVYGACREFKFRLDSYLLRGCAFATQLKIATTGKKFRGDVTQMVKAWRPELIALDSLSLSSTNTILIALMLICIRRDGIEVAGEFFKKLEHNEGLKSSNGYDGVELLSRVLSVRRAEGRTAGYDNLMQICGQGWTAYEIWRLGEYKKTASLKIADFNQVVSTLNTTAKS